MAITRGQMQRQLRQSGGIMNAASGTIGGGDYAGIPMGSRTGFGFLRKLKRRVRKIIPNEINIVSILDPPYDINGNGAPTTGNKPDTIPTFTKT